MSAERIYNLIEEPQDQDGSNGERQNQDGSSDGDGGKQADNPNADSEPTAPTTPGGFGQVLDAPEPKGDDGDTVAEQAREWKIAVEQAENVAKLAGALEIYKSPYPQCSLQNLLQAELCLPSTVDTALEIYRSSTASSISELRVAAY